MRSPWPKGRQELAAWGAVAIAGSMALSAGWLERRRPNPLDRTASFTFHVTDEADAGPGSLREAILAADRATGRARIIVAVPRIVLETVLPPIVNPYGVVVEALHPRAELDGTRLKGTVLDVASPNSLVTDLRIVGGAAGVVVRAPGTTLRNLVVEDADTGVLIGHGSGTVNVAESTLARNRIGVQVATVSGVTTLQDVRFEDHKVAAVWAAAPLGPSATSSVEIVDSRFRDDAIGLVVVNMTAIVEQNAFENGASAAVHASGGRVTISNNRILGGRGFGIYAERLRSGYITGNEIARNCNGGMFLRDVANTEVVGNEVYQNGYGLVLMEGRLASPSTVADNLIVDQVADGLLLLGSSPIVIRNQLLRNRKAGLRLSSLKLHAGTRTPGPLLTANVMRDNGWDEVQRDRYVPGASTATRAEADCAWRLGGASIYALQGAGAR